LARYYGHSIGIEVARVFSGKMSEVAGPFATSFDYVDLPLETFTLTELERQSKGRLHPDNRGHTIKALKQGTEGYSNASLQ
tara:strand:- start:20 stop:262 length:243 start_codon:yes stop_codon:yes gene_type:complete